MSGLRDRRGDGAVSWFPPRRCTSQSLGDHIDPVGLLLHDTLFLVCDFAPASVDDQWVAGFPCPRSRLQNRVVMSMQPRPWPEVPADTARVAKRAFRKGSLAIRARDELGCWYDDEVFAGAYGARGRPGISPPHLAMLTVLHFTDDLTARQPP